MSAISSQWGSQPNLLDLGDETPLTLEVAGVDPGSIAGVTCEGARVVASKKKLVRRSLFHLHHARGQELPARIGRVDNPENRRDVEDGDVDADFPGVTGLLSGSMSQLQLSVATTVGLQDIRITWRMPMGWKQGVVRKQVADLAAGARQACGTAGS